MLQVFTLYVGSLRNSNDLPLLSAIERVTLRLRLRQRIILRRFLITALGPLGRPLSVGRLFPRPEAVRPRVRRRPYRQPVDADAALRRLRPDLVAALATVAIVVAAARRRLAVDARLLDLDAEVAQTAQTAQTVALVVRLLRQIGHAVLVAGHFYYHFRVVDRLAGFSLRRPFRRRGGN